MGSYILFKNLTDFSYKRTGKQALGFYLAYFVLIVIVGALIGGLASLSIGDASINLGVRYGNILAILVTVGLSFLILNKKNLLDHFGYILLALLSGLLAFLGGALLGLIPVAYFTTK